mgnify:CR=1 FL=1
MHGDQSMALADGFVGGLAWPRAGVIVPGPGALHTTPDPSHCHMVCKRNSCMEVPATILRRQERTSVTACLTRFTSTGASPAAACQHPECSPCTNVLVRAFLAAELTAALGQHSVVLNSSQQAHMQPGRNGLQEAN